ncbi:MAG: hypothetical protein EXR69_06315 [Myxococcales bacterium]|nr:hypothetical protein [Myxococcales bacterium]
MFVFLGSFGCQNDTETTWTQYNASDNVVSIEVGAVEVTEAVTVTLTSNTGEVELGTGTVDPGGGPIGTEHTIIVVVAEDYASDIDRASVRLDAGERGEDEYDLDADATGEGYWVLGLFSVGDEGEARSDTLTFRLWTSDEADDTDTGSSGGISL